MNKKLIIGLLALTMVLTAGCRKADAEVQTDPTTEVTESMETVEPTMPGVEDSIFDTSDGELQDEEETVQPADDEAEKPADAAKPDGNANAPTVPASNGNAGDKPQDAQQPEEPEQNVVIVKPAEPDNGDAGNSGNAEQDQGVVTVTLDYETFQAMPAAQQQQVMEGFPSIEAFFDWYEAAKAQYEADHPPIEVDGGSIDLDDLG